MTKNYLVEGMTCEHCGAAVEAEIDGVPGTRGVEVDPESGTVAVTGEGFQDGDIVTAVEEAGCTVRA